MVRLDFAVAADQRVDLALLRLLVEVDAVGFQRVGLLLGFFSASLPARLLLPRPQPGGFRHAGTLGDAVRNVVDRIVAGHVLLLQEVGGMAFALGKDRHQHIGAGHLFAARRLHMNDRALDHPLETGSRLGVLVTIGDQVVEFGCRRIRAGSADRVEIDIARPHDGGRVLIVQQGQKKMLERRIFLLALIGEAKAWWRAFSRLREKEGTCILTFFP
jgi:hypothetical protein